MADKSATCVEIDSTCCDFEWGFVGAAIAKVIANVLVGYAFYGDTVCAADGELCNKITNICRKGKDVHFNRCD